MSDETPTPATPPAGEVLNPAVVNPAPMTLLDLDAAGLNPTVPAPPELIQFLYDNSRTGYVTLWCGLLSEPDGVATVQRWINDALHVYYSRSLLTQMAPAGDKPAGDHVTELTYGGPTNVPPPVCIDVPLVHGNAAPDSNLTCTMGNWGNVPTSYAYQWRGDGANIGTDSNTYTVLATDAGMAIDCVVTATNDGGSTTAPPSNAMMVPGARITKEEKKEPREHHDRREHREREHHDHHETRRR